MITLEICIGDDTIRYYDCIAVPRKGDSIKVSGQTYVVHDIVWEFYKDMDDETDIDCYVHCHIPEEDTREERYS